MSSEAPFLGIIQLANKPLAFPGNLGNPSSFPFPVRYRTAHSAFVKAILAKDPAVGDEYAALARELVDEGASAVMATCGFSVVYQGAMSSAVGVPVGSSSLLLLQQALQSTATANGAVGVVTFDTTELTQDVLSHAGAGESELERLRIGGLEGTETWHQLRRSDPVLSFATLRDDVHGAIDQLLRTNPDIEALLLECSAICPFAEELRARTSLPVFDFLELAGQLMASASSQGEDQSE